MVLFSPLSSIIEILPVSLEPDLSLDGNKETLILMEVPENFWGETTKAGLSTETDPFIGNPFTLKIENCFCRGFSFANDPKSRIVEDTSKTLSLFSIPIGKEKSFVDWASATTN